MWKFKKPNLHHPDNENKIEYCVLCHKPLDIPWSTPIELREHFICGCGQLCEDCYKEIAQNPQEEALTATEIERITSLFHD